eukprot:12329264-Prorocentrum_lima.AAC.1
MGRHRRESVDWYVVQRHLPYPEGLADAAALSDWPLTMLEDLASAEEGATRIQLLLGILGNG